MKLKILAVPHNNAVLAALTQFYLYERSEIEPLDILDTGLFQNTLLQDFSDQFSVEAFLIYDQVQLIGFSLISQQSRLRMQFSGHTIETIFILRRYRRHGVGRHSAIKLFDRFPGSWEVATHGQNVRGMAFWRSVIDIYTNGNYEETWLQDANWRGTVHSFEAPCLHIE